MTQPCPVRHLTLFVFLGTLLSAGLNPVSAQNLISPVHGYLSVDPFELRKEFVFQFLALAPAIGQADVTEIDAGNRAELEKALGDFLENRCPVRIDGKPLPMDRDRVHFVRPDPEKGLIVDDRKSIAAKDALVGAVFAAAWDAPPQELTVTWDVFPPDGQPAIVEAGAPGQRAARKLTPENPELAWKNEGGVGIPELLALPPAPEGPVWRIPWALILAIPAGAALGVGFWRARKKVLAAILAAALVGGSGWLFSSPALTFSDPLRKADPLTRDQADEICYALLRNVYHAFDYRRESDIYDTLSKSVGGDLLTDIYLEVQRSLQLENQGGARVRVYEVDLRECQFGDTPPAGGGFAANCEWVAVGTVTHWGHTHNRINRYKARLTVTSAAGQWKLEGLDLESEERIDRKE